MIKVTVRNFLFFSFLFISALAQAQFANILMGQNPKPIVTKTELDIDSANYLDKPNTYRDKRTNLIHSVYTEFDKYKSAQQKDSSYVVYTRSTGREKTWSTPVRISKFPGDCSNSDNTVKPDFPCTGPNGEVYVCWAGPKGLAFQRSLDGGDTWENQEKLLSPIKGGWDQRVEGLKTNGIPRIACADTGEFKGRVFITWSDEKNGEKNKDVFLVYSDDKGESWTDPLLITYRPNHKDQFNPAISIQPSTGHLFITYFDRQNYVNGTFCDLYMAVSYNGGLKFYLYRLNEKPVMLDSNVASVRGLAFMPKSNDVKVVWSQIDDDNTLSIYQAMINDSATADYIKKYSDEQIVIASTFAFADIMNVDFELKQDAQVCAVITKPLDPSFAKVVFRNQDFQSGQNTLSIDTKELGLKKGNYVLTLYYNNRNNFVWITE